MTTRIAFDILGLIVTYLPDYGDLHNFSEVSVVHRRAVHNRAERIQSGDIPASFILSCPSLKYLHVSRVIADTPDEIVDTTRFIIERCLIRPDISIKDDPVLTSWVLEGAADYAASHNRRDAFEYFAKIMQPINVLYHAARAGYEDIVRTACQNYAYKDEDIHSAIMGATTGGHQDVILFLIKKSTRLKNRKSINKNKFINTEILNNFMFEAVKCGHSNLVHFYISKGVSPKSLGMVLAVEYNQIELANFFRQKGGSISGHRDNLVELSAYNNRTAMINYLYEIDPNPYPYEFNLGLKGAATGGHRNLVDFFIKKGAKNFNEGAGHAIKNGHVDIFEYLMTLDLERMMFDTVDTGDYALVGYFVAKGCDSTRVMLKGLEAKKTQILFYRSLLDHGADFNSLTAAVNQLETGHFKDEMLRIVSYIRVSVI